MIPQDLLDILVCPETKQALAILDEKHLELLNTSIQNCSLKNRRGETVVGKISCALIREDGLYVYPVREGIPILLPEEGISTPR